MEVTPYMQRMADEGMISLEDPCPACKATFAVPHPDGKLTCLDCYHEFAPTTK